MGEAKRRKKLAQETRSQAVKVVTLFEFDQDSYHELGRRMLVYPSVSGTTASYVTSADLENPDDPHHAFFRQYNPEIEFILHRPINPRSQVGIPREVEP